MPRNKLIQIRRDTAANWASTNPILAAGEAGLETDTKKIKYGDGSTAWNTLSYLSGDNVPYTGATADVDVGNYSVHADNFYGSFGTGGVDDEVWFSANLSSPGAHANLVATDGVDGVTPGGNVNLRPGAYGGRVHVAQPNGSSAVQFNVDGVAGRSLIFPDTDVDLGDIVNKADISSLATVAFSGDYSHLTNKPTVNDGATGATGPSGSQGPAGATGATGASGATGPAADTSTFVQKAGDSMTGDLTFAAGKADKHSAETGNSTVTRSSVYQTLDDYSRPWAVWLDKNARLQAGIGWHGINFGDAVTHNAWEVKTSVSTGNVNPLLLQTRFAIESDTDLADIVMNYLDRVILYKGDGSSTQTFVVTADTGNVDTLGTLKSKDSAGTSYVQLYKKATAGSMLQSVEDTGSATLDFEATPTDGTSSGIVRLFRNTNTTNTGTAFAIYNATNANVLQHFFGAKGNSYVNVFGGNFGVGTSTNINSKLTVGTDTTTAAGGVLFGTDTNLYRSAADTLKTDDNLIIGTAGTVAGSAVTIDGTQTLTGKTLTSPVINTPTGITKSDVGLANVDNTSDANKPVSTATQTALDLKANDAAVVHLANAETLSGLKTFSAGLKTTLNSTTVNPIEIAPTTPANGSRLLYFNTERQWMFRQKGTGGTTQLELNSVVDGKDFIITSPNSTEAFKVSAFDTVANSVVTIPGKLNVTTLSSNLTPDTTLTRLLGGTSNYFNITYSRTLQLNSTTSINGTTADTATVTGRLAGGGTFNHPGTGDFGLFSFTYNNTTDYASGAYQNQFRITSSSAVTNWIIAMKLNPVYSGTGTAGLVRGMWMPIENSGGGTVTTARGLSVQLYPTNAAGTTTTWEGFSLDIPGSAAAGHTIGTINGIVINGQTSVITPTSFNGLNINAQTASAGMYGILTGTLTSTGGIARAINIGTVSITGGISDATGVFVGTVQNSGSGNSHGIYINQPTTSGGGTAFSIYTAGTGVTRLGGELRLDGGASPVGITSGSSANTLRLSGGTQDNGAVLLIAGSTHASLANTGVARVSTAEIFRWNVNGITTSKNIITPPALRTANVTLVATDAIIHMFDCTSGNLTATLPSAVGNAGLTYRFKKTDSTVNTLTVATVSSQTIDGNASLVLTAQWESKLIISNGTNWNIL